jgi:hypothetical protein
MKSVSERLRAGDVTVLDDQLMVALVSEIRSLTADKQLLLTPELRLQVEELLVAMEKQRVTRMEEAHVLLNVIGQLQKL